MSPAEEQLHIYRASHQPATCFMDHYFGTRPVKNPANRLFWAHCCRRRRPAKNLTVQVYYDQIVFWCRPEKGCKGSRS